MSPKKAPPLHSLILLICKRRLNQTTGLTWYYYFFNCLKASAWLCPVLVPFCRWENGGSGSHTAIRSHAAMSFRFGFPLPSPKSLWGPEFTITPGKV